MAVSVGHPQCNPALRSACSRKLCVCCAQHIPCERALPCVALLIRFVWVRVCFFVVYGFWGVVDSGHTGMEPPGGRACAKQAVCVSLSFLCALRSAPRHRSIHFSKGPGSVGCLLIVSEVRILRGCWEMLRVVAGLLLLFDGRQKGFLGPKLCPVQGWTLRSCAGGCC